MEFYSVNLFLTQRPWSFKSCHVFFHWLQLPNLWWMPNSVSTGFWLTMRGFTKTFRTIPQCSYIDTFSRILATTSFSHWLNCVVQEITKIVFKKYSLKGGTELLLTFTCPEAHDFWTKIDQMSVPGHILISILMIEIKLPEENSSQCCWSHLRRRRCFW